MKPVALYRAVGPEELKLIADSGWREFPPRLLEQPIFYPVVQKEYAIRIARDWNAKASGAGFVTRFEVNAEYLSRFEMQRAGGREHAEYWIPAEQLDVMLHAGKDISVDFRPSWLSAVGRRCFEWSGCGAH